MVESVTLLKEEAYNTTEKTQ